MTELAIYIPEPHDPPALQALPAAIGQLQNLLPADTVRLFVQGLALYFRASENLHACEPSSVMQAVLQSARMGLHLGTEAYLVPFTAKKTGITTATLITGYKGLIALAMRRHGIQVTHDIIRHGDVYTEDMGVITSHSHSLTPGRTLAAYAIATHPAWSRPIGVMVTLSDVAKYKGSSNFWRDNFDEMMSKTAVRKLFNRGFIPTEDADLRSLINLGEYDARPVNTSQRITLPAAAPVAALPDLSETPAPATEEAF